MRRAEAIAIGLAIAFAVIGISVRILTIPLVTDALVDATGGADLADLEPGLGRDLAQQVRGYVTGANPGPLPQRVGNRSGFSADAVSHLDDVRAVMSGAGWVTVLLVAVVGAWGIVRRRGQDRDVVVSAMRSAGLWILIGIPVLALAALLDFDRFFAGFHSLFFTAGTWQFPADDLLIQLFPEPFWATAGALWGLLVCVAGIVFMLASRAIGNDSVRGYSAKRSSDT